MDRKPSSVYIISPVTQQVEQLRVHDAGNEIEGVIRVRNDDEQCRLPVSKKIQFQFIVAH